MTGVTAEIESSIEGHRTELTGYCYRMLGSAFEAEDAVQETMVRAWRAYERFEGRSTLRSWLYRIATNVCLDMAGGSQRRARPMDLSSPSAATAPLDAGLPEVTWIGPVPDSRVVSDSTDPAEAVVARESIRLAFIAALQHLPPRQRVVLILREVLSWPAAEVAESLGTTVASVNSALQRARATLGAAAAAGSGLDDPISPQQRALLARYVDAFERYDVAELTALLHEDATMSMPPYAMWLRGPEDIRHWWLGTGVGCKGSRLLPVRANGAAAYGQYRPCLEGGFAPWALQVIESSGDRITAINSFLDTARLFPMFGLPDRLPDRG